MVKMFCNNCKRTFNGTADSIEDVSDYEIAPFCSNCSQKTSTRKPKTFKVDITKPLDKFVKDNKKLLKELSK